MAILRLQEMDTSLLRFGVWMRYYILSPDNDERVFHPGELGEDLEARVRGAYTHGDLAVRPAAWLRGALMNITCLFFVATCGFLVYDPWPALVLAPPFSWPLFISAFLTAFFFWLANRAGQGWPFRFRRYYVFDRGKGLVHIPRLFGGWETLRWRDVDFVIYKQWGAMLQSRDVHLDMVFPPSNVYRINSTNLQVLQWKTSRRLWWLWSWPTLFTTAARRCHIASVSIKDDNEKRVYSEWVSISRFMSDRESALEDQELWEMREQSGLLEEWWWCKADWPPRALYEHWKRVGWKGLTDDERKSLEAIGGFARFDPDQLPDRITWWRDEEGDWHRVSRKPPPDPLPEVRHEGVFWDTKTGRTVKLSGDWDLARVLEHYYRVPRDAIYRGEGRGWEATAEAHEAARARPRAGAQAVPEDARERRRVRRRRRG